MSVRKETGVSFCLVGRQFRVFDYLLSSEFVEYITVQGIWAIGWHLSDVQWKEVLCVVGVIPPEKRNGSRTVPITHNLRKIDSQRHFSADSPYESRVYRVAAARRHLNLV